MSYPYTVAAPNLFIFIYLFFLGGGIKGAKCFSKGTKRKLTENGRFLSFFLARGNERGNGKGREGRDFN